MNVTTILIIVNVFAALSIIVLALMQTSKGDMGSAFGGGGSQGMFGARGSANFLSRSTSVMCAVFFISSLSLAYLYAQRADLNSVIEQSVIVPDSEIPSLDIDAPVVEDESTIPSIDVDEASDAAQDIDAVEAIEDSVPEIPAENQ